MTAIAEQMALPMAEAIGGHCSIITKIQLQLPSHPAVQVRQKDLSAMSLAAVLPIILRIIPVTSQELQYQPKY